jgi:hypothetical protein
VGDDHNCDEMGCSSVADHVIRREVLDVARPVGGGK